MEARIADAVRSAPAESSKAQLATDAFAGAVEELLRTLAYNAGRDPIDVVSELRVAHDAGDADTGIVLPEGTVTDAAETGVLDPLTVRRAAYETAVQVATLVLRVDDAMDATFSTEPAGPGESIYDDRAEASSGSKRKARRGRSGTDSV
jgi:chaperonin GroEL (HSP60 family)